MRFGWFILFICLSNFGLLKAQHSLSIRIIDGSTDQVLPGVNVLFKNDESLGKTADKAGIVNFTNLLPGEYQLKFSFVGYRDSIVSVKIPFDDPYLLVRMFPAEEALDEVIVSSTRTNSRIEDLPLKVEVLGLEEMDEESTLVPGNVASILGDLAVITIQRTNPINGNDAIRMQGLDPQYTLIARDGLPLFGGFSGSLGVLSIPPLDLKQVEIIKGSVSTLYGGGAIAGMINILSKEPGDKPQGTVLLNASTLKEKNINSFFSGKLRKSIGYTLFAGGNFKSAVDVNKDGFSEVPEHTNIIFHPRLFFQLTKKAKLNVGLTSTLDNRKTGDIEAVKNGTDNSHPYLRKESSLRNVIDVEFNHSYSTNSSLSFKSAFSNYSRELQVPQRNLPLFDFSGIQNSSYSELSNRLQGEKHTFVAGLNIITESFRNDSKDQSTIKNYDYQTVGLFVQDDWNITQKFTIETGMRYDHHNLNGSFFLPRIALFYKPSKNLSVRLASGKGYKAPNVLALTDPSPYLVNNGSQIRSEYSYGLNADINYKTIFFEEVEFSFNQAFYNARIRNPIRVINDTLVNETLLENEYFQLQTIGTDTYVQMTYRDIELYLGFNHTSAIQAYVVESVPVPFNPRDKFSTTLAYSIEGKWRMGIEASYSANQYVYGSQTFYNHEKLYPSYRVPNFWFLAAMVERKFPFGSIVLNVENLLDARQSKFESLVSGNSSLPTFTPVWGPLDGRVFNLSLKLKIR